MTEHNDESEELTCDVCGAPATTSDGICGAELCDNPDCLDAAWPCGKTEPGTLGYQRCGEARGHGGDHRSWPSRERWSETGMPTVEDGSL